MNLRVEIDGQMRDVNLTQQAIAMLAAANIRDRRLQMRVIACWLDPKDPPLRLDIDDPSAEARTP